MPQLVINPDAVKYISGRQRTVTWGEAVSAGDMVYQDSTTQKWLQADSIAASAGAKPASSENLGFALSSGQADQVGTVLEGPGSKLEVGPGVAAVAGVYIVDAAGKGKLKPIGEIASTDYLIIGCYGESDSVLVLTPIVTGLQQP